MILPLFFLPFSLLIKFNFVSLQREKKQRQIYKDLIQIMYTFKNSSRKTLSVSTYF